MNTLPPELLSLTFLRAVDSDSSADERVSTPTAISHVCGSWRERALDMPSLWSHIRFCKAPSKEDMEDQDSIPAAWIKRSKTALLDIEILGKVWLDFGGVSHGERLKWMLDLICPHSERWRSLTFNQPLYAGLDSMLRALKDTEVPNLLTFTISNSYSSGEWMIHAFQKGAPKLQEIDVRAYNATFTPTFLGRLSDIRVLRASTSNWSSRGEEGFTDLLNTLRTSPNLEVLELDNQDYAFLRKQPPNPRPTPIIFTRATQFEINPRAYITPFLPYIQLPNVHRQSLFLSPRLLTHYAENESFPGLRRIHLDDSEYVHDITHFIGVLAYFKDLESVTISAFRSSGEPDLEWVRRLAHQNPKLKELELQWSLGTTEDAVRGMVQGRIDAGNSLEESTIWLSEDNKEVISDDFIDWVKGVVPRFRVERYRGPILPIAAR